MKWQVCPECGIENPVEANFCWKCASPQRAYADIPEVEWEWEACQIKADFSVLPPEEQAKAPQYVVKGLRLRAGIRDWTVYARVRGPRGEYVAASAPTVQGDPNLARDEYSRVWDMVAQQLIEDGWERVGQLSTFNAAWRNNLSARSRHYPSA